MSLEAGHIWAMVAYIPKSPKTNQFFCICDAAGKFWLYFWLLCISGALLPVSGNHKAQVNTMPVTHKFPEMEISRCLCSQIGEHDEMKKNSLTLFSLFRFCSTYWNTNAKDHLNHFYLINFFSRHKGELSKHEENDLDIIRVMIHNTYILPVISGEWCVTQTWCSLFIYSSKQLMLGAEGFLFFTAWL